MKRTYSFRPSINNGRDDGHRDSIRAFYDVLKTNENDQEFIKRAISRTESSDIVKLILTKPRKNEFDIYILKEYLKMLPKLMTMINKSHDPNFFLTNLWIVLAFRSQTILLVILFHLYNFICNKDLILSSIKPLLVFRHLFY